MTALASSINVIADDSPVIHERTIGQLFGWAWHHSIRQLWLQPKIVAQLGLPAELPRREVTHHAFLSDLDTLKHSSTQHGLVPWMTVWDDNHYLEIAVPQWDRGNPWHGVDDGVELGESVRSFTAATGMLWKRSGAITSDYWLREHYRKSGTLKLTEYPEIANGNIEPDLSFVLSPNGKRPARYCHGFDANAMYLGAASSVYLPTGEASYSEDDRVYPVNLPGYWRYGERWLTTPTGRFEERGAADGFISWHEYHRFLEPWYKVLRDARMELLAAGGPALDAVKQVYRQGIGRFGSTRRASLDDPLYQPYWRHAVQATARCNLLRAIAKMKVKPVTIDVDCLYFMTGTEDPLTFAKRVGIPIGDGIGQYKVKGTMRGRDAHEVIKGSNAIEGLRTGTSRRLLETE